MVSRSIIAEAETEFVLLENIFEKRRDLPFSHKSDCKNEKNMVSFMEEQNIICSQTKLDEIGHELTSGQFFFQVFVQYIFFRPFRLSLAPFICPWVSEDGMSSRKVKSRRFIHSKENDSFSRLLNYL